MISVICLIIGLVYLFKRPGIARMESSTFPGASQEAFDAWKRRELMSIDVLLMTTWGSGLVFLGIGLLIMPYVTQPNSADYGTTGVFLWALQLFVGVAGILVSACIGTSAQKLKAGLSDAGKSGSRTRVAASPPVETPRSAPDRVRAKVLNDEGIAAAQQGNSELAMQKLRSAIAADPTWGVPWNNLGVVYRDKGESTEALRCLSRATELNAFG